MHGGGLLQRPVDPREGRGSRAWVQGLGMPPTACHAPRLAPQLTSGAAAFTSRLMTNAPSFAPLPAPQPRLTSDGTFTLLEVNPMVRERAQRR